MVSQLPRAGRDRRAQERDKSARQNYARQPSRKWGKPCSVLSESDHPQLSFHKKQSPSESSLRAKARSHFHVSARRARPYARARGVDEPFLADVPQRRVRTSWFS